MRMTHQRDTILAELLATAGHPTVDELYERIKRKLPRISLATVYRNLDILVEAGMIRKLEIRGRQKRFDWELLPHDHVICVHCQRIDNVRLDPEAAAMDKPVSDLGYRVSGRRVEFYGLCPQCARSQQPTLQGDIAMPSSNETTSPLSDKQRQVLAALAQSTEACGSKELSGATGLDAKQISCQMTALKNKGLIDSPVRCKYCITDKGRQILG